MSVSLQGMFLISADHTIWEEERWGLMFSLLYSDNDSTTTKQRHRVKRITSFWRVKSNIIIAYYLYAQIAFVMVFDLNHAIYHAHMSGHWHQTWCTTSWCDIFEFKWYLRATPEVFSTNLSIHYNKHTYEFRRLDIYNIVHEFEVSRTSKNKQVNTFI